MCACPTAVLRANSVADHWVGETEIQDANGINGFQVIIAISSFRRLTLNGEGSIVDTAILEKLLPDILDFNNELLALLIFTIQIKNSFPVRFGFTLVLRI